MFRKTDSFVLVGLVIAVLSVVQPSTALAQSFEQLDNRWRREFDAGDYDAAYKTAGQMRKIAEGPQRGDRYSLAFAVNNQALALQGLGRYEAAEPLFRWYLQRIEKVEGPWGINTAIALNNLATLYSDQGRYAEAEPLSQRSLSITQKVKTPDHPDVAIRLNNLGVLYIIQHRYAEAEPLQKRALAIWERTYGTNNVSVALGFYNVANCVGKQGRYLEAEPLCERAIAIRRKLYGEDDPVAARYYGLLAWLYMQTGRFEEAERTYEKSRRIQEKILGSEHDYVAEAIYGLGRLYARQGRHAEAEPLLKQSMAIWEKSLGDDHWRIGGCLYHLAALHNELGRYDEAEELIDRALSIYEACGAGPLDRCRSYLLRAKLAHRQGRGVEAVDDLREAIDLAEQQRAWTSGAEHDRAQAFGEFREAFELMVCWQTESGNVNEAVKTIERGRARSLLDEIGLAGADLNVGRSAAELKAFREREAQRRSRVTMLEKKLQRLSSEGSAVEQEQTRSELLQARAQLYEHYRDEKSSSPVYRNLLAVGAGPPRLSQIQRRIVGKDGLLLIYLLGQHGGYLVVVGPKQATLSELVVDETAVKALDVDAGPLTAERLKATLAADAGKGLLEQLKKPNANPDLIARLAALWKVLIPEEQRAALTDGAVKRLIVVPDAGLALLPFETLVTKEGGARRYLLDDGPPIEYAPSATVLYNLLDRRALEDESKREPVLSVGDPVYPTTATARVDAPNEYTARSRYFEAGGQLARLPFSRTESRWVSDTFSEQGVSTLSLLGKDATESKVRDAAAGRKVVHFACHGLTDQAHGNFFGALAFTPGSKSGDPSNDGFLTLAEIYGLDLKGCQLAILSACDTNFGPEQRGEGVWALSRGFLVAGARRVVASNWLVDDEAAASLISYFCSGVAQSEKKGETVDYAQKLHEAKRWIRKQEKWSSPYYWGTFVLVGPN